MDWANRFSLGGLTVAYCTFQIAWEVIKNKLIMNSFTSGSLLNQRQKIFALGG